MAYPLTDSAIPFVTSRAWPAMRSAPGTSRWIPEAAQLGVDEPPLRMYAEAQRGAVDVDRSELERHVEIELGPERALSEPHGRDVEGKLAAGCASRRCCGPRRANRCSRA